MFCGKAPSGWARRVKKICRGHIFSQSGKQALLATRAEGCRANARLRESAPHQSGSCNEARENVKASRAPSTASGPPSSRRKAIYAPLTGSRQSLRGWQANKKRTGAPPRSIGKIALRFLPQRMQFCILWIGHLPETEKPPAMRGGIIIHGSAAWGRAECGKTHPVCEVIRKNILHGAVHRAAPGGQSDAFFARCSCFFAGCMLE